MKYLFDNIHSMLYEQRNWSHKSIRKVSVVNYITSKVLDKQQML